EGIGYELWRTDGTTAGTIMLKDINPSPAGSMPMEFYVYNEKLYFRADNGTDGYELWVTDGSEAGTIMLKDIHPTGHSNPSLFTEYNGKLFFSAQDGTTGYELWATD